jgi:hypothetical protein
VAGIRTLAADDPIRHHALPGAQPGWDVGELVMVVQAATVDDARSRIDLPSELLIESLSFLLQTALVWQNLRYLDITPPVAAGDQREFTTQAGAMADKFTQSVAMGGIAIDDVVRLPAALVEPEPKLRQALGWYVKALSTPFTADQFIFLWIAVDLFRGMSGISVVEPYTTRCGHKIASCPTCNASVNRELQGQSVQKYLVDRFKLDAAVAARIWKARQIMHGAVAFDSAVMDELGELVQITRSVVAAELKAQLGVPAGQNPQVGYGAPAIHPGGTGVGGTSAVSADDLAWPDINPARDVPAA